MNAKSALRPPIASITPGNYAHAAEEFQNEVLRPILKMQNELILALFWHTTRRKNPQFDALTAPKKAAWVTQLLRKDLALRHQLIGLVLGMLEHEEWDTYAAHASELNKRILTMTQQRILDNLNG